MQSISWGRSDDTFVQFTTCADEKRYKEVLVKHLNMCTLYHEPIKSQVNLLDLARNLKS